MWYVKPPHLSVAVTAYAEVCDIENPIINHMLENIKTGRMRDPTGDPNTVKKQTKPTSNTNDNEKQPAKKKTKVEQEPKKKFDEHVAWTHFILPELESKDDEKQFIETTCTQFGYMLKDIESTDEYLSLLQEATNSPSFYGMLVSPSHGPTFHQFIESCDIKVATCDNLNSYIVLDDCRPLKQLMFDNLKEKKYELEGSDEEDEDDHDDDADNNETEEK